MSEDRRSVGETHNIAKELEKSCKKAGIKYRHCGELGNKAVHISKLIESEKGQAALASLAEDFEKSGYEATVMMCSEKESRKCSRSLTSTST